MTIEQTKKIFQMVIKIFLEFCKINYRSDFKKLDGS